MRVRVGLAATGGLLLLSALWACGWLVTDLLPHSGARKVPLPLGQTILFGVFAAITSLISAVRGLKYPRGRHALECAGVGIGLFVIPAIVTTLVQNWISHFDVVAALCLTAVFAVVLEPFLQNGPPHSASSAMGASLVAITGVLCLFPLEAPISFGSGVGLCALFLTAIEIAATNCIAITLAHAVPGRSTLPMAALASGASAACFAVIATFSHSAAWNSSSPLIYISRVFLVDIPALFLLFWLMRRLSASQMTARFLFAPLFASLAGLALAQMLPSPREFLGMVLLAGGSAWLLFAPSKEGEEEPASIRVTRDGR